MNKQNINSPVKEGDELTVRIGSVGKQGDGITRVEGFVLFVPGVQEGERVKIKVTKVLPKNGFAEVIERVQEAPKRAEDKEDFGKDLQEEDVETFGDLMQEK